MRTGRTGPAGGDQHHFGQLYSAYAAWRGSQTCLSARFFAGSHLAAIHDNLTLYGGPWTWADSTIDMYSILTLLSSFVIGVISALGYAGVVLMMAVESACIPLPSEVIMPFAGYLAATGRFSLNGVAMAGTLGCLLGSYVAYGVGASGGRRVLERWGYLVLISRAELEAADRFFERWGALAIFTGRLLPVIRTFIAFPAGVARMRLMPFTIYTVLGSYIWCFALAWVGVTLGQNWESVGPFFHRFDDLIAIAMIAGVGWLIYRRIGSILAERRISARGSGARRGHG